MSRRHRDELDDRFPIVIGQLAFKSRARWHDFSLFRPFSKAIAFHPQRWSGRHGLQHLLAEVRVCDDFNRHEVLVAAHMIDVVMGVNQVAKGFIGDSPDGGDEVPCRNRRRRGIDYEHTIVADYNACVGNALVGDARSPTLDIGVDVGRELPKLGLPARNLGEFRVRGWWNYRRRGCWC